jgi:hypothetical protein
MQFEASLQKIVQETHISKITRAKQMEWRFGSGSKAPALQLGSPEFKPESHKKKKKKVEYKCF